MKRTHFWSCGQETAGHAPARRQGAGRDPGAGSLSGSPTPRGGPACRRSSTSAKELPGFQVELTEDLAGSVTAGGKLAPGAPWYPWRQWRLRRHRVDGMPQLCRTPAGHVHLQCRAED